VQAVPRTRTSRSHAKWCERLGPDPVVDTGSHALAVSIQPLIFCRHIDRAVFASNKSGGSRIREGNERAREGVRYVKKFRFQGRGQDMTDRRAYWAIAVAFAILYGEAAIAQASPNVPPTLAPNTPAPAAAPPLPGFRPGMTVLDRTGSSVGVVKGIAHSTTGPTVIVKIGGRLVGLQQSTLRRGEVVLSSQSRAEMLSRPLPSTTR
jgi:hypothetical protein